MVATKEIIQLIDLFYTYQEVELIIQVNGKDIYMTSLPFLLENFNIKGIEISYQDVALKEKDIILPDKANIETDDIYIPYDAYYKRILIDIQGEKIRNEK